MRAIRPGIRKRNERKLQSAWDEKTYSWTEGGILRHTPMSMEWNYRENKEQCEGVKSAWDENRYKAC